MPHTLVQHSEQSTLEETDLSRKKPEDEHEENNNKIDFDHDNVPATDHYGSAPPAPG